DITNYIKSQSQLVINLPINFTLAESDATIQANSPAFSNVKHINNTNNKTVQLVADLNVDVGVTVPEGKTLKFNVNAPTVASDRLYVMFVLARGTYIPELVGPENAYLGPVSEILIEVKP
ncbi:MAG TPA: hypothetical protein VD699_04855, partial [Nitrosopumilaceae archaeon]|nr:hypothetical protein [Nitrosopumilaceae archaeon]